MTAPLVAPTPTAPRRPAPAVREVPRLSGHLAPLDGVRGLAILLVLAYHFTLDMSGGGLAGRVLFKLTSAGWCGVDLFFVLSGFLITGILADSRGTPRLFVNFYARRSLRIFPLYYATLLASAVLSRAWGVGGAGDAEVWLWAYGTNVLVGLRGAWFPLSHFWSLAVEEHFYLFWPAVVVGLDRRAAMRVCAALVVLALAARVWLVAHGAVLAAYCLTVCRVDALALGGFLALSARGPGGPEALRPPARPLATAGVVALGALAVGRSGLAFHDPVIQTLGYLLLALTFTALLALVVSSPADGRLAAALGHRALRALGRYSYGLYVFNSVVILAFEGLALRAALEAGTGSVVAGRLLYVVLASVLTFAAAWSSWHALEKRALALKRHFPADGARPAGGRWPTAGRGR